jgi:hypothetical protein
MFSSHPVCYKCPLPFRVVFQVKYTIYCMYIHAPIAMHSVFSVHFGITDLFTT